MASKRAIRRRSCVGKIAYTEQWQAARRAHQLQSPEHQMSYYKCDFGDHYHVGHTPAGVRHAVQQRLAHLAI